MEELQAIIKRTPELAKKTQKNESIVFVGNTERNFYIDENENIHISKYNDEIANSDQIRELLKLLFVTYQMTKDEQIIFLSVVSRAKMTVTQLRDSINNYLDHGIYKPKPAEIIRFNKQDEENEIFPCDKIAKICDGLRSYFYDMNQYENIIKSTEIYDRARDTYFQKICKSNGTFLKDKNGFVLFILTDFGKKKRKFLQQFLDIKNAVLFHDSRINKEL